MLLYKISLIIFNILWIIFCVFFFIKQNEYLRYLVQNETSAISQKRINIMNGMGNQYYINFDRHYMLFKLFGVLISLLDENNIDYFLISGGLLGYYRHNKTFIPWDDDIDIVCMADDKNKIKNIITNFCDSKTEYNIIFNDIFKFTYNNTSSDDTHVMIDIFFYHKISNNIYHYDSIIRKNMFPREYAHVDELYPPKIIDFYLYLPDGIIYDSLKVKTPNQSIGYLNRCYPSWENNSIVYSPHNAYYRFLFNRYHLRTLIEKIIKKINNIVYKIIKYIITLC